MSHSNTPKQSNLFLWFIVPAAAALTLLLTRHNHSIHESRVELQGTLPIEQAEKKMPAVEHSEGIHVVAPDSIHDVHEVEPAPAVQAPAH